MKKRGQLTVFIIAGILLVLVLALILGIQKEESPIEQRAPIPFDVVPVNTLVTSCLQDTLRKGVDHIGLRGGYYTDFSVGLQEYDVPYYLALERDITPSKEFIQNQISLYIEEQLDTCLNFLVFADFSITQGQKTATTLIATDSVITQLDFPLTIQKTGVVHQLTSFTAEVPIRLGTIYDSIQSYMAEQKKDASAICLSCMSDIMNAANLHVDIDRVRDDTFMFIVLDNTSNIEPNRKYRFVFANQYTIEP